MNLTMLTTRHLTTKLTSCCLAGRNYSSRFPRAVKLAYSVYNQGADVSTYKKTNITPIIIIPGLFGSKTNWNSLSKSISLKTGRDAIAIDVRNHGESEWSAEFTYDLMKDDLLLLMEELNIDKVNLIGHSLGGRTAMFTTLLVPDSVEKLITVDISPISVNPEAAKLLNMIKKMKTIQFPKGIPMSEARKIADEALKPVADSPEIRQFLITNIRENPDKTFQWRLNLDALENGIETIKQFQCPKSVFNGPTLFIAGELSDYLKPNHHDEILTIFPQATFQYIKGAGHWLHAEKPKEFLDLVIPFLKI